MFPSHARFSAAAKNNKDKVFPTTDELIQLRDCERLDAGSGGCLGCCKPEKKLYSVDTDHRSQLPEKGFDPHEVEFLLSLGIVEGIGTNFKNDKHNKDNSTLCPFFHGSCGLKIDHRTRMEMPSIQIFENQYVAISYKHMHWKEPPRNDRGERDIIMPTVEGHEVKRTMEQMDIDKFWHDGVEKRHANGNPSCANGL